MYNIIKIMDLTNKNDILLLKKEISKTQNNIYFETRKIENYTKIEYRIRRSLSSLATIPDIKPYKKYIDNANKNSLSTHFYNLSKNTILVIPIRPYANIYQFAIHSSNIEWLGLFRKILKNLKKGQFISTHGHGVNYLHVRIENYPKYYKIF